MPNAETGVNIRDIKLSQMKLYFKESAKNKSAAIDTESQ
jgi:hypothetical protein